MTEKALYQQVVNEMTNGQYDDALWAMVWTKAGGDDAKARASYIEARVQEIAAEQKRARKVIPRPWPQRIPWGLVSLVGCTAAFAVLNQHIVRAYTPGAPELRWEFYLLGIAGSTLGLLLFPAFALLLGRKSPWGLRLAFLVLFITGNFAGRGGVPLDAADRSNASSGYTLMTVVLVVGWLFWMACLSDRKDYRPTPDEMSRW